MRGRAGNEKAPAPASAPGGHFVAGCQQEKGPQGTFYRRFSLFAALMPAVAVSFSLIYAPDFVRPYLQFDA